MLNNTSNRTISEAVYRIDLENAVYNSLNKEIAVAKTIDGEKLLALKSYLSVLKNVGILFHYFTIHLLKNNCFKKIFC